MEILEICKPRVEKTEVSYLIPTNHWQNESMQSILPKIELVTFYGEGPRVWLWKCVKDFQSLQNTQGSKSEYC